MSAQARHQVIYRAGPTLSRFHQSTSHIRGVRGPRGSGKSTGMCAEILMRAHQQAPSTEDGLRHSRWAVIRNTYVELRDTTLKTWMDWFGTVGELNQQTMVFIARFKDIELEVLFRALDRPKDIKKLLSLELTGAWFNEAREIPKSLVDAMDDSVGRYPSMREGGCTWNGIIMDTNSPDSDHWWYRLAEEECPEGWEFFDQPGGLIEVDGEFFPNPLAENIDNLIPNYYMTRKSGKSLDHIRVFYCNQYGFVIEGRPVIPEYRDAVHCSREDITPIKALPIHVGIDWGLTPAAVFEQKLANGRWVAIDELCAEHMGAKNFGALFSAYINERFQGFQFVSPLIADPAGMAEAQTDEQTVFQIFNAALRDANCSLRAAPASTNDPTIRHGALGAALSRIIDGRPGYMVSPRCKTLRKGLAGGYAYKRVEVAGEERFHDKPIKNRYSHPVEAAEYGLLGAGEGVALVHGTKRSKEPGVTVMDFNPFSYERDEPTLVIDFNAFTGEAR